MEHNVRVEQDPREDRQDRLEETRHTCHRQRLLLSPREQHPVPRGHPSRQLLRGRPSSLHELWCYRLGNIIQSNRVDKDLEAQVIGHEITHGFDDQGRTFDSTGNLANWWERSTEDNYLDKAQCIIWQYGNYTARPPVSINLNGINTQGENIADNGGIKEAYNAYQRCHFLTR